jgi:hypothetical protein
VNLPCSKGAKRKEQNCGLYQQQQQIMNAK